MSAPPRFVVELRPPRKGERYVWVDAVLEEPDADEVLDHNASRWVIVTDTRNGHPTVEPEAQAGWPLRIVPPADPVPADPGNTYSFAELLARSELERSHAEMAAESFWTRETGRVRIDVPLNRPEATQRPSRGERIRYNIAAFLADDDEWSPWPAPTDEGQRHVGPSTPLGPSESTNTAKEP
jgi:hypothetical protein